MAKTTLSKLEIVMHDLDIPYNKPDELIDFLADVFIKADYSLIQFNAISNRIVADTLFALTGHRVCPSNFTYYKSKNFDLTALVAAKLNIPIVDSAKCRIDLANKLLLLRPFNGGSIEWFNKAFSASSPESIKAHYETWKLSGGDVGSKRNWPNPYIFEWCKSNTVMPSIPVSHDTPTKLRKVFRYIDTLVRTASNNCPKNTSMTEWLDQKLLEFCKSEVLGGRKINSNWLTNYINLPEIRYVESVAAVNRRQPYIYCRLVDGKSKFGKAEGSTRFKSDDIGVVIGLKQQEPPLTSDIEHKVIKILKERGIYPTLGSREHYLAPLIHLVPIIMDIIAATPYISTQVSSVFATTRHSK
jgi:hypothetical protein